MLDLATLLRRQRLLLSALGIALLVAGSWTLASAYAAPVSVREVERATLWEERASYSYSVPVTRNSTHWPIGTVLPMGEPAYFRTVSDHIDVEYAWALDGDADLKGIAAARMEVVIEALTREGRTIWTIRHALAEGSTESLSDGLRVPGVIDLDALHHEVSLVTSELPMGDALVNWSVETSVVYALQSGGRHETGRATHVMPIRASEPRYELPLPSAIEWATPHESESVTVSTAHAGLAGAFGSLKGLGLSIGGLVALALGGLGYAGTDRHSSFERELRRYREWVSVTDAVPSTATRHGALIDVRSLEDLVHVAADARTRVVLDEGARVFYALLPGVTYRYSP